MSEHQEETFDANQLGLEQVDTAATEAANAEADQQASDERRKEAMVLPVEKQGVVFDIPDNYVREIDESNMTEQDWESFLFLPSVGYKTSNDLLDPKFRAMPARGEDPASDNWGEAALMGMQSYERENFHQPAIDADGAEWMTFMQTEEKRLSAIRSGFSAIGGGQPLTGIKAVAKAMAYTTTGSVIRVPLPHTGIWITIKAPLDAALLELERRIALDRVEFGRLSGGRVFSHSDVILKSQLIALLMDHIVDHTYPDPAVDLRTVIKLTDLNIALAWLALSIYPDSFPFTQACLASPNDCKHIVRGQINIAKTIRYNNARFSTAQRRFIARTQSVVNLPELKAYQDEFVANVSSVHDHKGQVRFTFRTPTLLEYLEMGTAWIQELETATDEAFGAKISIAERNQYIRSKAAAGALRQYCHWVERITYLDKNGEANSVVEAKDAIFSTLEVFSADEQMSTSFFEGVRAYINAVSVAICAIPNYVCPACKKLQPTEGEAFRHLIPIEASTVFFTVLSHRIVTIAKRNAI